MYPVDPFNPREDAQRLRDAMSSFGTDESAIIDVLCRRPADQRVIITETYNDAFGRVSELYFTHLSKELWNRLKLFSS